MHSIIDKYADLQDELKKLHSNYGKIPKWQFMLESVKLNDKLELLEEILKEQI